MILTCVGSVTPLKANFMQAVTDLRGKELQL